MLKDTETVHNLITYISDQLIKIYPKYTAHTNAWFLLEKLTQKNQAELIADKIVSLNDQQKTLLESWIKELVEEHKPLQYILGSVPFLNTTIFIEPPLLIPRPETEEWCNILIQQLISLKKKSLKILDLCTGSGCIAIALAKNIPESYIHATDISPKAIEVAQKNAYYNNVTNIVFYTSDLFENVAQEKFDLIISNPPYIDCNDWEKLDPEVKNWEDKNALCAADNGLEIIKKIIYNTPSFLVGSSLEIPQLWIEIGYNQGLIVKKLFESSGFKQVKIIQDINNKDRVVTGFYCESNVSNSHFY